MSIVIRPYSDELASEWENFCATAVNSTFLHSRNFLSYHNDRFLDLSLMIYESEKLVALFPAAESPTNKGVIVSHPGITFGGLIRHARFGGEKIAESLSAIAEHYKAHSYFELEYKATPYIYSTAPAQDDLYALFRLGANRSRCDLSCAIDLNKRPALSQRRRRGLKKSLKNTVLSNDLDLVSELYEIITENLARKHKAKPVHSLKDLNLLIERFPKQIKISCALIEGKVEAGIVLFNSDTVCHAQYISASEIAYKNSALDVVFDSAISEAKNNGFQYFDFGTSNEDAGQTLNNGLFQFKSEFGGSGVAHEFYTLRL